MTKNLLIFSALLLSTTINAAAAEWNRETTDWSRNKNLQIGDWGMNRPGYPKGLYIHGISVKEGRAVKNPVIYDNDVYDDVFDDEWMFVAASLGRLNLVGQIVTPVLTDFWGFYHPEWIETAKDAYERAERSGINMKKIPPITVGTEANSQKEGEEKMSDGARLYVELINKWHKKEPQKPLIINIGGQAATLASAFCIDPSIADKCIVYYTDMKIYNGHYDWASSLVAKNFRVINWGDDNHWWHRKSCQSEWNVLPRAAKCQSKDNDHNSGEWKKFSDMNVEMLDYMVTQFQKRPEYCNNGAKGDGYLDGTFMHAWIPSIFNSAAIEKVRGGKVLQVTGFDQHNESTVKKSTFETLLNKKGYKF